MLELLGRGYVIQHCVSLLNKKNEERAYQYYVTDTLRAIANMIYRGNGNLIETRYYDIMNPKKIEQPDRTADEIIYSFQKRLGAKK